MALKKDCIIEIYNDEEIYKHKLDFVIKTPIMFSMIVILRECITLIHHQNY